jgi:ABC-type antimicrobial peptide transport system permease subunit
MGASVCDAIASIVAPNLKLAAIGAVLGLVLTWFARALVHNLIWGLNPHDAPTYIVVTLLMFAVAASASVLPALRLIKLAPAATLREE